MFAFLLLPVKQTQQLLTWIPIKFLFGTDLTYCVFSWLSESAELHGRVSAAQIYRLHGKSAARFVKEVGEVVEEMQVNIWIIDLNCEKDLKAWEIIGINNASQADAKIKTGKMQVWMGFGSMTSAILMQCSTNWTIKATGSWSQLCEWKWAPQSLPSARLWKHCARSNKAFWFVIRAKSDCL